jgi:hypothetical protein
VYFANASFCSCDIFSRNDVSSTTLGSGGGDGVDGSDGGDGVDGSDGGVDGGDGGDVFFTTVVYFRMSCDKDFILEFSLSIFV